MVNFFKKFWKFVGVAFAFLLILWGVSKVKNKQTKKAEIEQLKNKARTLENIRLTDEQRKKVAQKIGKLDNELRKIDRDIETTEAKKKDRAKKILDIEDAQEAVDELQGVWDK